MSPIMQIREDLIADYAAKNNLPFNDLMMTANIMEDLDIKVDYNNYEDKLIRMYHWLQWVKSVENNR